MKILLFILLFFNINLLCLETDLDKKISNIINTNFDLAYPFIEEISKIILDYVTPYKWHKISEKQLGSIEIKRLVLSEDSSYLICYTQSHMFLIANLKILIESVFPLSCKEDDSKYDSLLLSPTFSKLAVLVNNDCLTVFQTGGACDSIIYQHILLNDEKSILGWSKDESKIALKFGDNDIVVKKLGTYECYFFKGNSRLISAEYSPCGRFLAINFLYAQSIKVWGMENDKEFDIGMHKGYIQTMSWSPCGKFIVSSFGAVFDCNRLFPKNSYGYTYNQLHDNVIQVWNVSSKQCIREFYDPGANNNLLKWSPCGRYIANVIIFSKDEGKSSVVEIMDVSKIKENWDVSEWKILDKIQLDNFVSTMCWSVDGKFLVVALFDCTIRVLERTLG